MRERSFHELIILFAKRFSLDYSRNIFHGVIHDLTLSDEQLYGWETEEQ
jgi:hypothetical protein